MRNFYFLPFLCHLFHFFLHINFFVYFLSSICLAKNPYLKSENKLKIFKKRQLGYLKGSILIWNFEWIQLTLAMPNKFIFLSHKKNIILGTYLKPFQSVQPEFGDMSLRSDIYKKICNIQFFSCSYYFVTTISNKKKKEKQENHFFLT